MTEDRRVTDQQWDGAYGLATLYTIGFLGLIFCLMYVEIPPGNKEVMLTLIGIMSAAQLGIIKFFYDGSKTADRVQQANIARSVRSEAVVQEIARTAPASSAAAVAAATGAPIPPAPTEPIIPSDPKSTTAP